MTTTAMDIARERQLDWLLDEVLGGGGERQVPVRSRSQRGFSWAAAALVLLAIGVAFGVAWLRGEPPVRSAQQPQEPAWIECHGAGALEQVPADVTALRCFDFDDTACRRLAKFVKLERLDLSGMDVDDRGVSRSLPITDAGVQELKTLVNLRWLCLARCEQMKGTSLSVLEAMPRLEHLDLTYSGVQSPGVERLQRLPSLRTLVLSHCMHFHGDSLRAVAKVPGLRRLELQACTTIAAKDALHLVQLKELRHLDLRDCQGRFRGQIVAAPGDEDPEQGDPTDPNVPEFKDTDGDGLPDARVTPPPPPVEDGIGITDAVVEALAALPLETLLLGGSESLTDAIGDHLVRMTALRTLDLSNLPKASGSVLSKLPVALTSLHLTGNPQFDASAFQRLPTFIQLRDLHLPLGPFDFPSLLPKVGTQLTNLAVGTPPPYLRTVKNQVDAGTQYSEFLGAQRQLRTLRIWEGNDSTRWLIEAAAQLPELTDLEIAPARSGNPDLRSLASTRSLRRLALPMHKLLTEVELAPLAGIRLDELILYGTNCNPTRLCAFASKHWPGCTITLPNGARFRAP